MSRWFLRAALSVCLLIPAALHAQPLADRVPAGVELYIGWKGADALQQPYAGSHLQGVIEASQLPAVFQKTWPKAVERFAQHEPRMGEALDRFGQVARIGWRYPAAFYCAAGDQQEKAVLLIQAGAQADAVAQRLRDALSLEQNNLEMSLTTRDGLVIIGIGRPAEQVELAGAGGVEPLGTDPTFTRFLSQVQQDPALVYYVNGVISRQTARAVMQRQAGEDADQPDDGSSIDSQIIRAMMYLGEGFDGLVWSAGFEGKQWRTDLFIAAPKRDVGMVSLLESDPVSDEILGAIPKQADWVVVRRLDLNRVFLLARSAAEQMGPDALRAFDQVMGGATMALGTNLQQNLFEPLGDEWALYIAPDQVGVGLLGGVIINRTDDPARVNRALSSVAIAATNVFTNAMRRQNMSMQLRYIAHQGTRISYLPTPLITPAWAVRGNLLFIGFYPQTVAAALDAAAAEGSILDNETFQAIRKQLPDKPATSISFVNLPETAEQSYMTLLMVGQTYMGFADLFGVDGQPMLIPTLADLRQHLTPSARIAWVDDAGWHAQTLSPFPFSGMLGGEISAVMGQYPALAAILIPSLARARQQAQQVATISNLRQMGVAMYMHANDHKGQLPADLGELVEGGYITAHVFTAPAAGQTVPPEILAATPQEQAAWIRQSANYIYIRPADKITQIHQPGKVILIYENPANARPGAPIGAVFADGHAESLTPDRLNHLLQQQGAKPPGEGE